MKVEKFYIADKNGKSNCIIRTFCKLFCKKFEDAKEELIGIANELGVDSYAEIKVFEKYLNINNYYKFDVLKDVKINNLNLPLGRYAIFCYDKNDYYHMFGVIDDVIYDKDDKCLDLYVITVYKEKI